MKHLDSRSFDAQRSAACSEPDRRDPADRGAILNALGWCVLTTRGRSEMHVARQLDRLAVDRYVPLFHQWRQWSDRRRRIAVPAFPGYVFFRGDHDARTRVARVRGVVRVLGSALAPAVVPDEELASVRRALECGDDPRIENRLLPGMRVEVTRGPLSGLRGEVVRHGRDARLVVALPLLGQGISVDLDSLDVEPS